ncbi:MAG: crosslink repair DNA glycosylase YcaQ family protein [Woeseiaceae bacterium]
MTAVRETLSLPEARQLALTAQGFGPGARATLKDLPAVVRRLGLLQLDFVNVLVPAHYLVVHSRIGQYERERFDARICAGRQFTEQWAHEASIVPMDAWPLLEYRRKAFALGKNNPVNRIRNKVKYLEQVIEIINEKGPVTTADLPAVPGPSRKPGDWHRSVPRWALEYHFGAGRLAVTRRLPNFQRVYDLADRVVPKVHRERTLDKYAAQRELLLRAARASGVATLRDLADYYRIPVPEARPRVFELEEEGALVPVSVEGWVDDAWIVEPVAGFEPVDACALLSPFDPVVWYRPRAERLFDFHYRIEIYVPEHKRKWGYYVLPFLLGDRIVARVDLKADRARGQLLVRSAHAENGIDDDHVVSRLAGSLTELSAWLGLDSVKASRRGPFARKLHAALRASVS